MDGTYRLFDESRVTIAQDGEILISGDCVMKGYDKDEEYTKRVVRDGKYHTGDLGRINEGDVWCFFFVILRLFFFLQERR